MVGRTGGVGDPGFQCQLMERHSFGANCKEGMCGSCKVVKLSGEIEMNHQGGIRAREIQAGKFLPCCSTVQTHIVIDA